MSEFECRNCSGHRSHAVFANVPDRFQGFAGAFSYVACADCQLVQLERVPAHPGDYYQDYRIHSNRYRSRIYSALRRLTIGHCYLEKPGHGQSLLDIGCGNGSYMKDMAERGWRAVGYELDAAYAAELSNNLGLEVIVGEDTLAARAGEFDLVTFNFSFEHLDHPLRLLELGAKALKSGGQIYIAVPNIESREAAIFGDRWFHLDPPRHISFFTKDLLREHLEGRGFTDIAIKDLPVPTGFAGSMSYRLCNGFKSVAWYAGIVPGMIFSRVVGDGNFAISARRTG
jgi:SAM-dependent methyltransferase